MSFDAYCFSVNDVINGLNEYYGHGVDSVWPFLMIEHGVVDAVNGDPDILCQCCGFPTVKEVVMREREHTEEEMAQIRAMVDRGRFA